MRHRAGALPLLLALVLVLGPAGTAHAGISDAEWTARLGWLYVLPLGALQLVIAYAARKNLERSPVGWTIVAIVTSLVVGLVATATVDHRRDLVPFLAIAMVGPGVPVFLALVRARMVVGAAVCLLLPPVPFILWYWERVRW